MITDASQAWDLRFTAPVVVQAWLNSVSDHVVSPGPLWIIQSFLEWRQGRITEALHLIEQASAAVLDEECSLWRGRMLSMGAVLSSAAGELGRCALLLQEQLTLGRLLGDVELQALALNDLGVTAAWSESAAAHALYRQAFELIGDRDTKRSVALTALKGLVAANMAGIHQRDGAYDQALPLIALADSLLRDASCLMLRPWCVNLQVAQALHIGQPEQARRLLQEAIDLLSRVPEGLGESLFMLHYTAARFELNTGHPHDSLQWLRRIQQEKLLRDDAHMLLLDVEASAYAQLGDHIRAYSSVRRLLEVNQRRAHQERRTLVSRLELSEVAAQAQRRLEQVQLVVSDLQEQLTEVKSVGRRYRTLSMTDALTGLRNRRQFDSDLRTLKQNDGLLIFDIDHFKRVNDTLGHPFGDQVIRQVAAAVQGVLPTGSSFYRYGGEEFAVLLWSTGRIELFNVGEQIRLAVSQMVVPEVPGLTVSVGGAVFESSLPEHTVERADRALYEAKRRGRNRTHVADAHCN